MESSAEPGKTFPKYCSVATTLKVPAWTGAAAPWDLSFTCPFALQVPWLTSHNPLTRYAYHPCLHIADPAWQGPSWLGRVGDAAGTWVLARRELDGLYYRAQIKSAPELERQGALLVEFEAPLFTGPNLPAQRQGVVLEEDVIQFLPPMEYSLQPGDKVLASWESDHQRYGPGTVLLCLKGRDPQRASEEEITVHFWNGKTATVPVSGVRWVPPAVWKKAVERLYSPFTRERPWPFLWAPCCSLLGPITGYVTSGLPLGASFLCPPCQPHACCQLLCGGCFCCYPLAGPTWWPLTRASGVTVREHPEEELKPTGQLLPLEGPKNEEVAVQAPMAVSSSSSSSSSEENLENDLDMGLPQRLMVNSTVNTDPILLETSPRQGGLCQPVWRYWKRSGPEPHPGKPGTRCCNIWKEEKGNKQRAQAAVEGSTQELVLEGTNMQPLQALPKEAVHPTPSQGTATHQRGPNSP
ncbi:uncharacterized protein C11orf16 homolog [Talpa occidentalis]|uniref:uncharacterized protein C11orf16 homolog n=1 Tax=Talpa occidentalis TaxID=50954 RepID=UPI00188F4B82|nr:uncharacterized protein C11orf16 homolog [Talpa occidentalis]XP_037378529.1 uncharacterized protein C11orf16 homolog [Talpa occidentalis]